MRKHWNCSVRLVCHLENNFNKKVADRRELVWLKNALLQNKKGLKNSKYVSIIDVLVVEDREATCENLVFVEFVFVNLPF